jgi:NitT/TauT family transport system substrate-binding protein
MARRRRTRLEGALLGIVLLIGCGAPAAPGAPAPPAADRAANAPAAPSAPARPTGRAAYPAPDDPLVAVRAAWCAVTGAQFPLWLAKEAGIFARHRLDADIRLIASSGPALAALQSGEIDFLECSGGAVAPGLMAGSDGLYIANFYTGNFFRLMAAPDIQSVYDLRGRKLAISRPGDYTNRLAEVMLERHGLVPNQDVLLVPLGTQTEQFNGLRGGIVDAITINPPLNLSLQNEGFREIYNLRDMGLAGISVSLYATREAVRSRTRLVERFLAAMTETAAYARANREHTIQVMSQYMQLTDRLALDGAYDTYVPALQIPPYVAIEALQPVLDENLKVNPAAQITDAAQLIDNRPLQAVEASGFITAVLAEYGQSPN